MGNFGKRVKERRKDLGLSQQEVADLCDLSRTSVAKIEGGTQIPNLFTIVALAHALETTVGLLVGETPQVASAVPEIRVVPYYSVECEVCGLVRIVKGDKAEADALARRHRVPHPLPVTVGQELRGPRAALPLAAPDPLPRIEVGAAMA